MKNFKTKGFSLVELAIVMTIIAVILGMSASGLKSQLGNSEVYSTQQRIDAVKVALENYRTQYGKYPCPSYPNARSENTANYGIAVANCYSTGSLACPTSGSLVLNCTNNSVNNNLKDMAQGAVPFVTLGLPRELSQDAFGINFTYAVDARFTQDENRCETHGNLTVRDYGGNDMSTRATYVVTSHGSDTKGGYAADRGAIPIACDASARDGENCNNDRIFRIAAITKSNVNTNYYDDIATYGVNANYKSCPAGLVNCQVWLDASDKCTILTNVGGVHQLLDKSINGRHAVQNDSFYRPDYPGPKRNGISTIQFIPWNLDSLYVNAASSLTDGPYTLVTVFATQTLNYSTNFNVITDFPSYAWVANDRSHGLVGTQFRSYNWTPGNIYSSSLGYNDNRPHIAISTVGPTSNTLLFIDGIQAGSLSGTQSDFWWKTTIIIGSFPDNGPADYDFLEYLYFDKELTTTERKSLEQYLARKWGVNY
jgi:prepilin-type N-terminal cleavage/methylation domain-containing protein